MATRTFGSLLAAVATRITGLPGVTTVTRQVGGLTGDFGPATGTWQVGDWAISTAGTVIICTVAGTPGTWIAVYSDGNPPFTLDKSESAAAPATPASPLLREWVLAGDSRPYFTNKLGVVGSMTAIEPYVLAVTGALTVVAGKSRVYLEGNYVLESVRASVNTAPTGAAILIDVNKNGVTINTVQTTRPTIAAAAFTGLGATPAITTFAAGDYITVDVDQIGSTVAGSDLTVAIRLRKVV